MLVSMTTSIDTSSLLADIEACVPRRPGAACTVGAALDLIDDPKSRAVVANFIDTPVKSATVVCELLEKHDIHLAAGAVRRHRRRITGGDKCTCPLPGELTA